MTLVYVSNMLPAQQVRVWVAIEFVALCPSISNGRLIEVREQK